MALELGFGPGGLLPLVLLWGAAGPCQHGGGAWAGGGSLGFHVMSQGRERDPAPCFPSLLAPKSLCFVLIFLCLASGPQVCVLFWTINGAVTPPSILSPPLCHAFFFNICFFTYLAAPGLSCFMRDFRSEALNHSVLCFSGFSSAVVCEVSCPWSQNRKRRNKTGFSKGTNLPFNSITTHAH